jgi:hypothetical protein
LKERHSSRWPELFLRMTGDMAATNKIIRDIANEEMDAKIDGAR